MKNKILITGGSGFIGSALAKMPIFSDAIFVGRTKPSGVKNYVEKHFSINQNYDNELASVETVIHLAGIAHSKNRRKSAQIKEFNTDFTIYFAKEAIKNGVKRFIFISSTKVLGDITFECQKFTIESLYSPEDDYAKSKMDAEIGLIKLADECDLELIIIRPPLVIARGAKGNLDTVLKFAKLGVPLPFSRIKNKRSVLYLKDLTDIITNCVRNERIRSKIIMPKSGDEKSTSELLTEVAKLNNSHLKLFYLPSWLVKGLLLLFGGRKLVNKIYGSIEIEEQYFGK